MSLKSTWISQNPLEIHKCTIFSTYITDTTNTPHYGVEMFLTCLLNEPLNTKCTLNKRFIRISKPYPFNTK